MIKHNEYLLVEVPSMAFGFDINNYGDSSEFMYMLDIEEIDESIKHDETLITKPLPPGTYQLIGLAAELTEEQKKKICIPVRRPSEPVYYKLYNEPEDEQGDTPVATTDVNRAFLSLLRSHNLKPENTIVIKEIKK